MEHVLTLQMLPVAGFVDACGNSAVSCDSLASCRSDQSCWSEWSQVTHEVMHTIG